MKRLFRTFHPGRLQWKLTLSYSLVTVVAILALQAVAIAVAAFDYHLPPPDVLAQLQGQAATEIAPYLASSPPDSPALATWLQGTMRGGQFRLGRLNAGLDIPAANLVLLDVVDRQGLVVASIPTDTTPVGVSLPARLSPLATVVLADALEGRTSPAFLGVVDRDGSTAVAAPVFGEDGRVLGALFLLLANPSGPGLLLGRLQAGLLSNLPAIIAFVAAVGTLFGFLIARGLTRRLQALAAATQAWGQGDFSAVTHDPSTDEIGGLARKLNRMAEQVQGLLQARQQLAMLEERNRLARDLHDSVKQQVFATAMQVAAARALLHSDGGAAGEHLAEAERLARQAQQELMALIRELRPASLQGRGLTEALREYVAEWSNRAGIAATCRADGSCRLPLEVEQALYRVAQEALSNVARHSAAAHAELALEYGREAVTLTVADDGVGFDVAAAVGRGMGLLSMRERVAELGGTVQWESTPGQGARVIVRLPALVGTLPQEEMG